MTEVTGYTLCQGHNKEGSPCGAPALTGETFCAWHSQHIADSVKRGWAQKGAAVALVNREHPAPLDLQRNPLKTRRQVKAALAQVAKAVLAGTLPRAAATTVTYVLSGWLQADGVDRKLGPVADARGTIRMVQVAPDGTEQAIEVQV